MRKLLFTLIVVGLIAGLFAAFSVVKKKVSSDFAQKVSPRQLAVSPTPTVYPVREGTERTSLFVPYWSLSEDIPDVYDTYIYFGVTPTTSGIDTEELGYQRIGSFADSAPSGAETLLTLRMLDSKGNFSIIESAKNREAVIDQTLSTAAENGFSGVVLDLEIAAIPFDSVVENISKFVSEFSDEADRRGQKFHIAIYGDTFYRARPFDMKLIGSKADQVMIMAYDMHKARGNPGPNFPLDGKDTFGYDFETMIGDFSEKVDPAKLAVIFGLFGYDWVVNEENKAVGTGKSLAYVDIKTSFIDNCNFRSCEWHRDEQSVEITASYIDEENKKHIVWFEDPTSAKRKEAFLKKRGISSYSFWAHSYF